MYTELLVLFVLLLVVYELSCYFFFFFFKQKTAYEMRISDWSSDVCSSDLIPERAAIVRRIFSMTLDGTGQHSIAATLNGEGVEPWGKIGRASCRERVCQYV